MGFLCHANPEVERQGFLKIGWQLRRITGRFKNTHNMEIDNNTTKANNNTQRASGSGGPRSLRNILFKALCLFLLANLAFAACYPMNLLGQLSAYNRLFPGRPRLPYADNPAKAYSLSLFNLEAMLASHELAGKPKPEDEYRVILIGDSATWGYLLSNEETLAGQLNAAGARLPDGRKVKFYNLGYPVMSLTKDLLFLSYAMRYQPDLILWPLTLESFPYDKQLYSPLLQNNPGPVKDLISRFNLNVDPDSTEWIETSLYDRTILGARRHLADLLRLQLLGISWAATKIDQEIPQNYTQRREDLSSEQNFHNLQPPHLRSVDLAFDVLEAGVELAGKTPILFINEPMFISQGKNSDLRYNFYYPRWAYDDYRELISQQSAANGWHYLDLWDRVPPTEFTNTAVHLTPEGTSIIAQRVLEGIVELAGHQ
jgi:lysophospholipase L1-like esterase